MIMKWWWSLILILRFTKKEKSIFYHQISKHVQNFTNRLIFHAKVKAMQLHYLLTAILKLQARLQKFLTWSYQNESYLNLTQYRSMKKKVAFLTAVTTWETILQKVWEHKPPAQHRTLVVKPLGLKKWCRQLLKFQILNTNPFLSLNSILLKRLWWA